MRRRAILIAVAVAVLVIVSLVAGFASAQESPCSTREIMLESVDAKDYTMILRFISPANDIVEVFGHDNGAALVLVTYAESVLRNVPGMGRIVVAPGSTCTVSKGDNLIVNSWEPGRDA